MAERRRAETSMNEPLAKSLQELHAYNRRQSLDAANKWIGYKSKSQLITMNIAAASSQMILAAFTEWRLGTANPSAFLKDAIGDIRKLIPTLAKLEGIDARSFGMISVWDAMYAQVLIDEVIDEDFASTCHIVQDERSHPSKYRDYWIHPWDSLVLELLITGNVPVEWDAFKVWLKAKRGGANLLKTMAAYQLLIAAALEDDASSAATAVAEAEKCFRARRNMSITWGGGDVADRTVDHRLACAIKRAESIRPGITDGVETPHRWRW